MNSSDQESMGRIAEFVGNIREKGVQLWTKNGRLHYKAPNGALTPEEIEHLKVSKSQILALLEGATAAEMVERCFVHRFRHDRAPLAFSQLAHWHLYQLSRRRAIRQVASATRLHGRLNVSALRKSLAEIIRRHAALRTQVVAVDGVLVQKVSKSGGCEPKVDDLTALSESLRELEIKHSIEELILEPIDVAVDALFGVRLLRLRDDEHVLIIAMEHMISDAFSMSILLRDLFMAYRQALTGRAFTLPAVPLQFVDYAVWQQSAHKLWVKKHSSYWDQRLAGCQRLRFPGDQCLQGEQRLGRGAVPVQIGQDSKAKLREWCRLKRTTLVMSVFTAYVGLVLRWCNTSESLVQYQCDGRVHPNTENTIGYFSSALYLSIRLLKDDSFVDLLRRVTEEYCKAYEHADFSFMAAQVPRPEFTRNTLFNWVPQGSKIDLSGLDGPEDGIMCSQISFVHPMMKKLELDHEPTILLYDTDDGIVGDVYFSLNRLSIATMERFVRNFSRFIDALLLHPEGRVNDVLLL